MGYNPTVSERCRVTEIQITVGTFDRPENRIEAQQTNDQMKARS
jgi:hypothetical protein